jgi:hypothetical protein
LQYPPSTYPMSGSALVHLDQDGTHLGTIGGANCPPADELYNATIVCTDRGGYPSSVVRTSAGALIWQVGGTSDTMCIDPRLSPAADRLSCDWDIRFRDGRRLPYVGLPAYNPPTANDPESAYAAGWITNDWAVVVDANARNGLGLIDASSGHYRSVIRSGPAIYVGATIGA